VYDELGSISLWGVFSEAIRIFQLTQKENTYTHLIKDNAIKLKNQEQEGNILSLYYTPCLNSLSCTRKKLCKYARLLYNKENTLML
jgi:hypothetical protein